MVPALIVGALTAWYLGLRAGIIAAIVVAVALLVVMFVPVPGLNLAVYALIIAWSAAVYFLGSRISKRSTAPGLLGGLMGSVGGAAGKATMWAKKLMGREEKG
ncbi:MAG: hypothetical protein KF773_26585 [Deltaproteobacteria bacterium]|nr:hypothetical protein [Deltaproteobacteria bacterium]MCW5803417.1 hypothetical protein [Deltaproteobacteria bacterium]